MSARQRRRIGTHLAATLAAGPVHTVLGVLAFDDVTTVPAMMVLVLMHVPATLALVVVNLSAVLMVVTVGFGVLGLFLDVRITARLEDAALGTMRATTALSVVPMAPLVGGMFSMVLSASHWGPPR
jgi:hypothetical protein